MEDGNTPVEGPQVSAEVRSRSEGVLTSRKRRSEEVCHPKDPMMEHADGSEMRISGMAVILKSLAVASASGRVAELLCRNRFDGTAVHMGFERGLSVGPDDRVDDQEREQAEVACGGAASLDGTRATVCGKQESKRLRTA